MNYDIAIIGAGPGGYTAAIRAAQLGASVVLIEKESLGGTCLNKGCIPSKSIISSSEKYNEIKKFSKFGISVENPIYNYKTIFDRKNIVVEKLKKSLTQLIKSHSVNIIQGNATITDKNTLSIKTANENIKISFKNLLIATGSCPSEIPGLDLDHDFIINSDDLINSSELSESVLIVGSGAIGIEWARIFNSLEKKTYLIEIFDKLSPTSDISISERIEKLFKRSKIEFYTSTSISHIADKKVFLTNGKTVEPEKILIAAGRSANIENIELESIKIEMNGKFIKVDNNLKTNIKNIYSIGDVTGICQLAHVASHQGIAAVENIILNKPVDINYNAVPSVIYGNPEIASVGYTEQQLKRSDIPYKSSVFPMGAIGKSIVEDEIDGFVKVLSDENKILGAHIIAPQAASMIQNFVIAINSGITVKKLSETIFAHPAYSEAVYESVLGLDNLSLHMPKMN